MAMNMQARRSKIDRYISQLTNDSKAVRETAVRALGKIRDDRAAYALANTLNDTDEGKAAACALGWIGTDTAIYLLRTTLDENAVSTLTSALSNTNNDLDMRWGAAWALVGIGKEAAAPALLEKLSDKHEGFFVREAASQALRLIRDKEAEADMIRLDLEEQRLCEMANLLEKVRGERLE